jgi:Rps23 Pro-64 3,4-dihydroxylase Tpa1-like proline 4-hydroxylase
MTTLPQVSARIAPFPHTVSGRALPTSLANAVLEWFENAAPWHLRIERFYEQYELNLHQVNLAAELASLVADEMIEALMAQMLSPLTDERLVLVEANAHKLLPGQTIKIHNDFIAGEETHRVLIQINRNWTDHNGGMLMLFSSPAVDDIARIIRPIHGSGMAFEISPSSFHAVSTIHAGERYTLVYSFKHANRSHAR